MKRKIIPFPERRQWALKRLRLLAKQTGNIQWTEHVHMMMEERGISSRQVLETLRRGRPIGPPQRNGDEWKIVLGRGHAGRMIRVVVVMEETERLTVVTTW